MSRRPRKHRDSKAKPPHPTATPAGRSGRRSLERGLALALAVAVLLVFGRSLGCGFVDYDDPATVSENPLVRDGLSLAGLRHAFTSAQVGSWAPLTALSHQLDGQLFGLNPAGHHLTNVLLHAANSALLLLLLHRMTGSVWRSAGVAALFALHPLRVESVAWISERKDVLSSLFFLLTLHAYVAWTRGTAPRWRISGWLTLGLLSKSMLLTTPFVLLLLDRWPLQRSEHLRWRQLILEKMPLFLLCAAAGAAQLVAAREAIAAIEHPDFTARVANALVSCTTYLGQLCWPAGLCALYPPPRQGFALPVLLGSTALLLTVSVAAILWRRRHPWLFMGWFWQLIMLTPVLGFIQAGDAARADRYTCLPHIGMAIIIVWAVSTWCTEHRTRSVIAGSASALALLLLSTVTFRQIGFWKDTETLWQRALACTSSNDTAHYNLGTLRLRQARTDEAITHFGHALAANPAHATAHLNLGKALLEKNEPARALPHYRRAVELRPGLAPAHYNLGVVLEKLGQPGEAMNAYGQTLRLDPGHANAHFAMATLLLPGNQSAEVLQHCLSAVESDPGHANAHILAAWLLATSPEPALRNGTKAVTLATHATRLTKARDPVALRTLAAAQAEAGHFHEARQTAQRALDLAITQGRESLAGNLRREIALYRNQQPLREDGATKAD